MAYKYNPGKKQRYRNDTYTNFRPKTDEISEAQRNQKLETKFRLMIATEIAKRISEDESNLDMLVQEISENPRIVEHYKRWIEMGFDLKHLFKEWYRAYKPELEKRNKGKER